MRPYMKPKVVGSRKHKITDFSMANINQDLDKRYTPLYLVNERVARALKKKRMWDKYKSRTVVTMGGCY